MSILECKDITYLYKGTNNGVQNISFQAVEGDRIAIVGQNGAGKSTFLNMISGLTQPSQGTITCDEDIDYHDLGFSSQKQSIDWYLNVHDNVWLGAVLAGFSKSQCKKYTQEILEVLDLNKLSKYAPDSLSGGQQQRVQVARALVHQPKIMILDEPTAGLDFIYSKALFDYLYKKTTEENKILLVSSHDLSMLEDYCNKILFLEDGKQIFFGDMQEFLSSHARTKQIVITYSGMLTDLTKEFMVSNAISFNEQAIFLVENSAISINEIISRLLGEITILGVNSENITLKDVFNQRGK